MLKNVIQTVRDFVLKHYKLIFPIILVVCVAVTVVIALNANAETSVDDIIPNTGDDVQTETSGEEELNLNAMITDVALEKNENPEIWTLVCTYYNAVALGDLDTIRAVCDTVSEMELLRHGEMAKYIAQYPQLEVYTKPGPEAGSTMVYVYYKVTFEDQNAEYPGYQAHYVCTAADGSLYMKKSENTAETDEYILAVSTQNDVVEFKNKIEVEYNELMQNNPQMLQYLTELDAEIGRAVGELLAQQNASETETPTEPEGSTSEGGENVEATETQTATVYAVANATVNVRSSDSEQADKLGSAAVGTTLLVLEQGVNGWTKVSYENKEGFIKSEYLDVLESADGATVTGSVTATTNLNVRSQPDTNAERLGVLKSGASAELISKDNGWCKIKYNGRIGYVNADYVR